MLNRKLLNKTLTSQQVAETPDGENCYDAGKQWMNINIMRILFLKKLAF